MDSIPNDLLRLTKKHLSSDELIFLFKDDDVSYCKSIKEACRRFSWSWILYYLYPAYPHNVRMTGDRFQHSCLKEGYYGSLESGNIELISLFEDLHPDTRNDRLQVKYIAKNGNIGRLNKYIEQRGTNLVFEYSYLLQGITKTHNSDCLNVYKDDIIKFFNNYSFNFIIVSLKYAIRYNNKQILTFIGENLANGKIQIPNNHGVEQMITLCDIFTLGLEVSDSQLSSAYLVIPACIESIARVGRVDICSRCLSLSIGKYDQEMIAGAIKGHQQQILDLFDLKHYSVIPNFCHGYIETRDYENFYHYYNQLDKDKKNKYNQFFVVTAIRKCNYRALKLLLEDPDVEYNNKFPGNIIFTKDTYTAIVLSKYLSKFDYNIDVVVGKLNAIGYNKVADILLAAHTQ